MRINSLILDQGLPTEDRHGKDITQLLPMAAAEVLLHLDIPMLVILRMQALVQDTALVKGRAPSIIRGILRINTILINIGMHPRGIILLFMTMKTIFHRRLHPLPRSDLLLHPHLQPRLKALQKSRSSLVLHSVLRRRADKISGGLLTFMPLLTLVPMVVSVWIRQMPLSAPLSFLPWDRPSKNLMRTRRCHWEVIWVFQDPIRKIRRLLSFDALQSRRSLLHLLAL
jgi:hypothetical protein